jgi:hypothetical protein
MKYPINEFGDDSEIFTPGGEVLRGRTGQEALPSLSAARQVGSKAKDLLALRHFSGKVLAVLSDTIYLSTQDGEIFWTCPEPSPLHRRCILVSPPRKIFPGEKCLCQYPRLTFSGGTFIDLSTAREWNPPRAGARKFVSPAGLWLRFRRLLGVLNLFEFQEGMGRVISLIRAQTEKNSLPSFSSISILGRIQDRALHLARACLDQDFPSIAREGKEIIGLGTGLTPSGDDFLGGMFFAARSLREAYPEYFRWNEGTILDLLDWAKTRTHPISHAIFSDLALGHGPEPLHDFIERFMEGRDPDSVLEAALRLTAIGHSSGWDMLAGAMTGMLMIKRSVERGAWSKE